MTMEKLHTILQCIETHADIVGFTIAEYLPFDEHKLHTMFASMKLFSQK